MHAKITRFDAEVSVDDALRVELNMVGGPCFKWLIGCETPTSDFTKQEFRVINRYAYTFGAIGLSTGIICDFFAERLLLR